MKKLLVLVLLLALAFPALAESEPFTLELSGDDTTIITGVTFPLENLRVSYAQESEGEFEVTLLSNGESEKLLDGYGENRTVLLRKSGTYDLAVESSAPWTLTFESLGMGLFFEGLEGKGDYVSDIFILTKPTIIEIVANTAEFDHFAVEYYYIKEGRWERDITLNMLLDGDGKTSYKKIINAGPATIGFFVVSFSSGEWSINEVK